MKIYRRYLAREIAMGILLVLVGFLALFSFFDLIAEVRNIGSGPYQLQHALGFVLLRLPGRFYEITPFAVLIGTLYTLSALARHSEIAVLRTSGLSTPTLLQVLAFVAAGFAVFTFVVGEFITPPAERAAQQLRLKGRGQSVESNLRSGVWVKDNKRFINIRRVLPDSQLQGVRIYDFDATARLRTVTEASEGFFLPPDRWQLKSIVQTVLDEDRVSVVKKNEMEWNSVLSPDILNVLVVAPERMSAFNLISYIKHLRENKQATQRYSIAMWKKILYPFSLLVMVALALPFAYTHSRASSVSLKIFSGVMIGVVFHMLNGLFSNLGAINSWSPFISAIAPSALFTLVAMTMIWWVERR